MIRSWIDSAMFLITTKLAVQHKPLRASGMFRFRNVNNKQQLLQLHKRHSHLHHHGVKLRNQPHQMRCQEIMADGDHLPSCLRWDNQDLVHFQCLQLKAGKVRHQLRVLQEHRALAHGMRLQHRWHLRRILLLCHNKLQLKLLPRVVGIHQSVKTRRQVVGIALWAKLQQQAVGTARWGNLLHRAVGTTRSVKLLQQVDGTAHRILRLIRWEARSALLRLALLVPLQLPVVGIAHRILLLIRWVTQWAALWSTRRHRLQCLNQLSQQRQWAGKQLALQALRVEVCSRTSTITL